MKKNNIRDIRHKISNITKNARSSRLFKDSTWALFGNTVGRGMSLLSGMVVARFLGSSAFGEFGLIKSSLLTIATFSAFGLGYTTTKFIAENKGKSNEQLYSIHITATSITIIFSITIAVLTALFSNWIAIFLKAPNLGLELRLMAIGIVLNALITTQNGELAGFKAYKQIARNTTYYGIFTFIASVPLSYIFGIAGALIALLLSLTFNCILNAITLKQFLTSEKPMRLNTRYIKELIAFSLPIALQEVLYSVSSWSGSIIIIFLSSYDQLGLYSAASQWYAVILFVPGALRNVALSHLAENTNNSQAANRIVKQLIKFNFGSTIIPFIVITCLSKFIAQCYGESFSSLPPVLSAMTLYAVISSLAGVQKQDLLAHGYNWFLFLTNVAYYIVSLTTAYFLIKIWGHAALNYALSGLVCTVVYLLVINAKRKTIYKHQL